MIVHSLHFTVQHMGWVPTGHLYDKMTLIQQKPEALKPEKRNIQMKWTEGNTTSNNTSILLGKKNVHTTPGQSQTPSQCVLSACLKEAC